MKSFSFGTSPVEETGYLSNPPFSRSGEPTVIRQLEHAPRARSVITCSLRQCEWNPAALPTPATFDGSGGACVYAVDTTVELVLSLLGESPLSRYQCCEM